MKKPPHNLTPKQHRAMLALLRGATVEEAATEANAGRRTVERWRATEAFAEALAAARHELHRDALGELVLTCTKAARTLDELLDKSHPAHVRCSAAVAILKAAREHVELDDVARRIGAMERKVAERLGDEE